LISSSNQKQVRVLAVIVLYKMLPDKSDTYRTLRSTISNLGEDQGDIKILLYDNTPGGQDVGVLPSDICYKADRDNRGLAVAYNFALETAQKEKYDWLLTLDQDTDLPGDFARKLCDTATSVAPLNNVAAIVPCVHSDGQVISPSRQMKFFPKTRKFRKNFVGVSSVKTFAVNSASTIRVSALETVGRYDPRFPLDQSDNVLFHRLHLRQFNIFIAGNIHVEHQLSTFDLKRRSTTERYEAVLHAEEAYHDVYLGRIEGIALLLRIVHLLVYRLSKTGGDFAHFRIGLKFFCRRLFISRKSRIDEWEQSVK
jgi:GT2 family glycosyltransferase